jgi:hypothetical protein
MYAESIFNEEIRRTNRPAASVKRADSSPNEPTSRERKASGFFSERIDQPRA